MIQPEVIGVPNTRQQSKSGASCFRDRYKIPGDNTFNPSLVYNCIRGDELRVRYPSNVLPICETNPECPDDAAKGHNDERCVWMDVLYTL